MEPDDGTILNELTKNLPAELFDRLTDALHELPDREKLRAMEALRHYFGLCRYRRGQS